MARSDSAPFRREFIVTASNTLTDTSGLYIGDIKTLHIENTGAFSTAFQGKVGSTGFMRRLNPVQVEQNKFYLDVSAVEYLYIEVFDIKNVGVLTIFGYEDRDLDEPIKVEYANGDLQRAVLNTNTLKEIKDELKKLNTYMSIIVGDEL